MKTLPVIFLLALCSTLCAGEKLRRVTMEDIVTRLREEGIPVCFERFPIKKEDAITAKKKIALIEAIPADERTKRERELLAYCRKMVSDGERPELIIDWRRKQFDLEFPGEPVDAAAVLDAAVKADPDYQWKEIVGRYVVFLKERSFNQPLAAFSAQHLVFAEFMRQISEQVATPAKMGCEGKGEADGRPWWEDIKDHAFTLVLKDTDTRTALTLIANRLGPDVAWTVTDDYAGGRDLEFEPVSVPKR